MALDHVALYVETGDPSRLASLLGPVFAQQCEAVRRATAELQLVTLGGWTAVLGAEALDGRIILAEGLSREVSGRAAALELTAAAFRWQFAPFRSGERLRPAGFGAAPQPGAPMPLYPDAELEAFHRLVDLGVPPALALLTPDALGEPGEPLPSLRICWGGASALLEPGELRPPAHPASEPPVRLVIGPAGERLEPRVVSGRPNAPALQRLLALEAAYCERATAPVRFLYRHAPENEDFYVARELAGLSEVGRPSLLSRLLHHR
ncbi:MAG: hypothetical protein ACYDCL_13625 [Myxococcales bacterium]